MIKPKHIISVVCIFLGILLVYSLASNYNYLPTQKRKLSEIVNIEKTDYIYLEKLNLETQELEQVKITDPKIIQTLVKQWNDLTLKKLSNPRHNLIQEDGDIESIRFLGNKFIDRVIITINSKDTIHINSSDLIEDYRVIEGINHSTLNQLFNEFKTD